MAFATALTLGLASPVRPAAAQAAARPDTPVFTIIVTRHGVRAISLPPNYDWTAYAWADWSALQPDDLTRHGYHLIRLKDPSWTEPQCRGP